MISKTPLYAVVSFSIMTICVLISNAQIASTSDLLKRIEVTSVTPQDVLLTPSCLTDLWANSPVPLHYYNSEQITAQKVINKSIADVVVTYNTVDSENEWIDIDHEEITPYTWKWIDLELSEPDGTLTKVSLRRPNWWIKKAGADSIGKAVFLDLSEVGVKGWATVQNIRVNQLDTRLWDLTDCKGSVARPITGKFHHKSRDVYQLFFSKDVAPIGVTGNHPIWSVDKNAWVRAADLAIGEHVKTPTGTMQLMDRKKVDGEHVVYNLEVYRDHTYFASLNSVLVHNKDGWDISRTAYGKDQIGHAMQIGNDIEVKVFQKEADHTIYYYIEAVKMRNQAGLKDIVSNISMLAQGVAGNFRQHVKSLKIVFKLGTLSGDDLIWFSNLQRSNKTYAGFKIGMTPEWDLELSNEVTRKRLLHSK